MQTFLRLLTIAAILILNVNAILKNEDPVEDGQADPISYDQKMEQDKDGVQAAATPKMIYYGGQGFLTKGSLTKNENEATESSAKKKDEFNWSEWWDEDSSGSQTPLLDEPITDENISVPESTPEPPSQPAPESESVNHEVSISQSEAKPFEEESLPGNENENMDAPSPEPAAADDWW